MPGLSGAAAALLSPTCLSIEHARLRVIASAEQLANASHAHLDEERAALLAVQSAAFEEARACASSGVALDAAARAFSPLPTGSAAFDSLLCGGLRRGEVVELCGAPASGKTQLCLCAAASAARAGLSVLYLDSTAGFSAARLAYFMQRESSAGPAAPRLAEVRCVRAFDIHAVLAVLDELASGGGMLSLAGGASLRPSLVVVDSASVVLSPLLTTKHSQGHALMLTLVGSLRALADDFSLAVLLTNHTAGGRDGAAGSLKPALGETWKSQPHTRIHLTLGAYDTGIPQVNEAAVALGRNAGARQPYSSI